MSIGSKIAFYRKKLNITQENLAQQLQVTNQAVSKWESDQCCPDIQLLPRLADIFGVSIDELFDRAPAQTSRPALPWEDDGTLRVVVYNGHTLLGSGMAGEELVFQYEGPALNIESDISVTCGDVEGNVMAGMDVTCDNVDGDVHAGGNVTCDNIDGDAFAGGGITCDDICGNATAGGSINCDEIEGNAQAGGSINQGGNGFSFHFSSDTDTQEDSRKNGKKGFTFRF